MGFINNYLKFNFQNNMLNKIDFVWSTIKGYSSLYPLYNYMKTNGLNVTINKVYKLGLRNRKLVKNLSKLIIIAYDQPLVRLEKSGWEGEFIYIEHGLSPMKYYTYKYDFFHRATLLFYPGEVFKRKMEKINPNFKNGLLGGYPKIDSLLEIKINKTELCHKYNLDELKPIILFAPSWGGKRNKNAGIHNAKYLQNIKNLIIIPHSADYQLAKKYKAIVPKEGSINDFLQLSDIIISDVSSVLAEASIIGKKVIQLILSTYPGCFPEKDKRKDGIWVAEEIIKYEEENTNRIKRPFKIPYLDEDWDFGNSSKPENVEKTIESTVKSINELRPLQQKWKEQSCYKPDGKTSERMTKMITQFIETGERIQVI